MPADFSMPAFRDESDPQYTWIWDATSHSYVRAQSDHVPDRSHADGGDNNLFDPASQDGNYFKDDNPLQEGILARTTLSWAGDTCPQCGEILNDLGICPGCNWSPERNEVDWQDSQPQHTTNGPFPERTPKPNPAKTDNSFPSMMSNKTAGPWQNFKEDGYGLPGDLWGVATGYSPAVKLDHQCPQCGGTDTWLHTIKLPKNEFGNRHPDMLQRCHGCGFETPDADFRQRVEQTKNMIQLPEAFRGPEDNPDTGNSGTTIPEHWGHVFSASEAREIVRRVAGIGDAWNMLKQNVPGTEAWRTRDDFDPYMPADKQVDRIIQHFADPTPQSQKWLDQHDEYFNAPQQPTAPAQPAQPQVDPARAQAMDKILKLRAWGQGDGLAQKLMMQHGIGEDELGQYAPRQSALNKVAALARALKFSADDWDEIFFGPEVNEVGKFVIDMDGNMHYEPGANADHTRITKRDHITEPGCLGSVYTDGTAQIQRTYPGFQPDSQAIEQQLGEAFGPGITITHEAGGPQDEQEPGFEPFTVRGMSLGGRASGPAFVLEHSQLGGMQKGMILVAEHLQPEHFPLYQLAAGIVTATGGANSHAAIVARQSGIPTVVGIGAEYNKIATGNLLIIDEQGVTVAPDAETLKAYKDQQAQAYTMAPLSGDPQAIQKGLHEHMRRNLEMQMGFTPDTPGQAFAHVDEQMAFEANQPNLDDCPECGDVMVPGQKEACCHNCGHKQTTLTTTLAKEVVAELHATGGLKEMLMALPALAIPGVGEVAEGAAIADTAAEAAGGAAGGAEAGGASGKMGDLMNGAMNKGKNYLQYQGIQALRDHGQGGGTPDMSSPEPQGVITHVHDLDGYFMYASDDEEIGAAVKDRGDDEHPDGDTQGFDQEHGGQPELLKDVDDEGGPKNPHTPEDAMKAFKDNEPLVIEYANSDQSGEDHPILKALDELLESVFPGYREQNVEHHPADNPQEAPESHGEGHEAPEEGQDTPKDSDEHTSALMPEHWGSLAEADIPMEHLGWTQPQPPIGTNGGQPSPEVAQGLPPAGLPGQTPGSVPPIGGGGMQCQQCGQPHDPGAPCVSPNGMEQQPPMPPQLPMQQNPMQMQTSVDLWRVASDDAVDKHSDPKEPSAGSGDTGDHDHGHGGHPGHDWVDAHGQPLMEGQQYELLSPNYAIPDKVTVERVLPDKIVYTIHTDMMDYQDEMTREDQANEGYQFSPAMEAPDSDDGFNAGQQEEHPIRPGQDAQPQVDDLSDSATVVSHEVDPSQHPDRAWLYEDSDPVGVDPHLLASMGMGGEFGMNTQSRSMPEARYAGKDYSPREQREFIDEPGVARNADRLDLSGTHYEFETSVDDGFLW